MPSKYSVSSKEFGRGPADVKRFSSLLAVQEYVKGQWQGVEYVDGPQAFHSDYCTFTLRGCTLADLGARKGVYGTDEYWFWEWKELDPVKLAELATHRCRVTGTRLDEVDGFHVSAICLVDGCGRAFGFFASGDEDSREWVMADCGRHYTARDIEEMKERVSDDKSHREMVCAIDR